MVCRPYQELLGDLIKKNEMSGVCVCVCVACMGDRKCVRTVLGPESEGKWTAWKIPA